MGNHEVNGLPVKHICAHFHSFSVKRMLISQKRLSQTDIGKDISADSKGESVSPHAKGKYSYPKVNAPKHFLKLQYPSNDLRY